MKSELYALLASTLRLSSLVNRMDLGVATEQEQAVHRLLVNINKYASSVQASLGIRRAQEILGGNGWSGCWEDPLSFCRPMCAGLSINWRCWCRRSACWPRPIGG